MSTLQERIQTHITNDITALSTAVTNNDYGAVQIAVADIFNDAGNALVLNEIELLYPESP